MDDVGSDNISLYFLLFYPSSKMCQAQILAHAEV